MNFMRHVIILNPALSVRSEQYQAVEGKRTAEIAIEHARRLLKGLDRLDGATLVPTIRKPFDQLAERLKNDFRVRETIT